MFVRFYDASIIFEFFSLYTRKKSCNKNLWVKGERKCTPNFVSFVNCINEIYEKLFQVLIKIKIKFLFLCSGFNKNLNTRKEI